MFFEGIASPSWLLLTAGLLGAASVIINEHSDYSHYQQQIPGEHLAKGLYRDSLKDVLLKSRQRIKPVTECIFVTSESGPFVYTSLKSDDDQVCGIYFVTDPDRIIELEFISFDVPCEYGGLVSVVDGWELNGEVFPSERDHRLSLKQRINELCGNSIARTFRSSQNAGLIQYRVPKHDKGFTVFARYPKNSTPCNVLAVSTAEPFTLRNYGRRINCTYAALYPSKVQIIALEVGTMNILGTIHTSETGTLRKCDETNTHDQVQMGGSHGLDTSKIQLMDSVCGTDSKPDYRGVIKHGVTSVRLISSGFFDNSVTVNIQPLEEEFLDANLNV